MPGPASSSSAPILTATVLTVLGIWLFKTVAQVFVLLMLGVLDLALPRRGRRVARATHAHLPERAALAVGDLRFARRARAARRGSSRRRSIEQTRQLIAAAADVHRRRGKAGIDKLADEVPGAARHDRPAGRAHARCTRSYGSAERHRSATLPTKVFEIVQAAINIFAVGVMGDLSRAASGALSRVADRALSADPSRSRARRARRSRRFAARVHRRPAADDDLPRRDHGARTRICSTFRSALPFGIFTGLVAIVPFFGTLLSTTLPALFVLTGTGYHGFSPLGHALLVVGLGVVVHLIEGNIVSPLVMSKKVDLPPVLTIMAVLVIGQLLGGLGLDRRAADARRR